MRKHIIITLVVISGLFAGAGASSTAQMPSTISVITVQDCQDGLLATLSGTVHPEEVLIILWSFSDDIRGIATNQLALTGMMDEEIDIVLPHVGLTEGDSTTFRTVIVSPENLSLAFFMVMSVLMSGQPPTETTLDTLGALMSITNQELVIEPCSIGDAEPTVSNYNFEDFDWAILFEDIAGFFQPFLEQFGQ